jgi:hypothetical protein
MIRISFELFLPLAGWEVNNLDGMFTTQSVLYFSMVQAYKQARTYDYDQYIIVTLCTSNLGLRAAQCIPHRR